MKALIAEDNILLGKSIKRALEEADWIADIAIDGAEALYFAESGPYDVIILDWMLPKISGIELVTHLRAHNIVTPIIMITAKDALQDRIDGLTYGADDYLIKPFDIAELMARVHALYRRSSRNGLNKITVGSLSLDSISHSISINERTLELTGKEYDLLAALVYKAGELVHRNALVSLLYSTNSEPDSNSLDVLLTRVRKKLSPSDIVIETIRGKGFILRVETTLP